MEIPQYQYLESSMCSWGGKEESTSSYFRSWQPIASPNLLSRDGCYTLGVLKPCYSVETLKSSSKQPKTDLEQCKMHGEFDPTFDKERNWWGEAVSFHSWSLYKEQLQGIPLKKQDILRVYSDVFTGIGKFPGPPYKFQLKPNAKPARHALRHVPIHLQEAFHKEIRNLECLGILEPVKEVTEWVNSFVIVEKKVPADSNTEDHSSQKKLRICLDPRDLNEALEWEPYYTRSIKEILGKFHGMTWFMIANFNKGFWMVELHPKSRKLTTMALDIGRFQWTRLPMGSIMAQDVFQWKLNVIFLSVPGVTGIADDMIIFGKTDQDHDGNLLNFLEVMQEEWFDPQPWQDAILTSKGFILQTHLEQQRSLSWPKENRSSEENGNPPGCGNDEKLPRID